MPVSDAPLRTGYTVKQDRLQVDLPNRSPRAGPNPAQGLPKRRWMWP